VTLTEAALEHAGHGWAPTAYTWLAAGSEGRREQTLKTDQDNGLVYADPPAELAERAATYFGHLAGRTGAALERLGFPPCPGGFMASNPEWRQPASTWREKFRGWMETPYPERVLAASLYFDLRPVAGDAAPGRDLWEWVCEQAPAHTLFHRYMAQAAVDRHPPIGLFGRFVVERSGDRKDTLDLKARGVFPMTMAMRAHALSLGIRETHTVDRLVQLGARGVFSPPQVDELRGAHELMARLRLAHQLACLDAGVPPDNFVNPQTLGKADRVLLKEAFKTLGWLQGMLADRFQTGMLA
jgi:CBS domain-containing protein